MASANEGNYNAKFAPSPSASLGSDVERSSIVRVAACQIKQGKVSHASDTNCTKINYIRSGERICATRSGPTTRTTRSHAIRYGTSRGRTEPSDHALARRRRESEERRGAEARESVDEESQEGADEDEQESASDEEQK
ncbi:hypothetical protein ON010_g17953 [Phytophthora cinnamomi]|nr:hypothetical protein ON010_g17953 [Phytophthora cinnamomi]